MTPGDRVRQLRLERGLTQKELADRIEGVDAATVSNIELGKTPLGPTRAKRFALALGVTAESLRPGAAQESALDTILRRLDGLEDSMEERGQIVGKALDRITTLLEHLVGQAHPDTEQAKANPAD